MLINMEQDIADQEWKKARHKLCQNIRGLALLKGQVIKMSVVIIGGDERMEQQYKQICKKHKCKAKVFTRMSGNLKTQIGQPDLIILFTSTVAHKMVHCALKEAERYNIRVERAHSSSASALENVLQGCC